MVRASTLIPSPIALPTERTQPAYYEVIYDLAALPYDWHLPLRELLARHENYVLLQVDIRLTHAGSPHAKAVADGQLDEAIDGLCFGLQQLGRPVFLRLAPEANSPWNDYDPEAYRRSLAARRSDSARPVAAAQYRSRVVGCSRWLCRLHDLLSR